MFIEVNGKMIETDEEGFLLDPNECDKKVALALIGQHEADGHKQVTEVGGKLIHYFRDYYQDHMMHPSMHRLFADHEKLEANDFEDKKSYQKFLYNLFPNGPAPILCMLAGLPRLAHEMGS